DKDWTKNYGGVDDPNPANRSNYIPVKFTPRQNPFYCALPYNDKAREGHRPEASRIVPWFNEAYQGPAVSTCKSRWIAIRKGNRVAYAQWEDAGPFRTDHWQYVFGNERPKPNLNKGAGEVNPFHWRSSSLLVSASLRKSQRPQRAAGFSPAKPRWAIGQLMRLACDARSQSTICPRPVRTFSQSTGRAWSIVQRTLSLRFRPDLGSNCTPADFAIL